MWIKGGTIFDPVNGTAKVGDIQVKDGRIEGVYAGGKKGAAGEAFDAKGLWVLPGLIDMHVHLRDPGYEYKEDIVSGGKAAAAGGVTAVACMPNTDPVNDNPSTTRYILQKAAAQAVVRVLPVGALTKDLKGVELAEMGLMKEAGIVAVSDDGKSVESAAMMRRALEYAATFGLPVITHCQDKGLSGSGVMNEGALSSRLGLGGIPAACEDIVVARDILLSGYTGIPVHITHLSTKTGLDVVRQARANGVKVTCDVTPHHLLLTEKRVEGYDTNAKMYPPLRTEEDRRALVKGLKAGIIDCIATDHAPHVKDEKDLDFDLAPFGIIGLQTLLPSLMVLHLKYKIDFLELLKKVTVNPARILGVEGGTLSPGAPADITLFDPAREWVFDEAAVLSKSKNSPFLGTKYTGKVVRTIVAGRMVYEA
jgi:dihydroorotase